MYASKTHLDRRQCPLRLPPGVWATHGSNVSLFPADAADRGEGLEALAEDGDPSVLAATLGTLNVTSGVFNTPDGASEPGPLVPGGAYEFTVEAAEGSVLSFATMFVQSNDLFLAPNPSGIPLFDSDGNPLAERDITDLLLLWDAGTEANEAPLMGPTQALRQQAENPGDREGVVRPFLDSTRAMPAAQRIATIAVTEASGTYTITMTNVSEQNGTMVTPLAPLFYATHNDSFTLFDEGSQDRGEGLELLAESGAPTDLLTSIAALSTTDMVDATADAAGPGATHSFDVTPTAANPRLSIATMIVESNDVFLAFSDKGVALLDSDGNPRPAADVQAEMNRVLAVWDAGTEANEVPGVGVNQPLRGGGATGEADPTATVRRYADDTNDLAKLSGEFLDVTITSVAGREFTIEIQNVSDDSVFPATITDVLWATHDGSARLFDDGMPASNGLELLAELGSAGTLRDAMAALSSVSDAAVEDNAAPGGTVTFNVTLGENDRYLNLASMIVPTNDTFWSLGPVGIELIDSNGTVRDVNAIATDIAELLSAWDAGTEANQSGAIGADQPPRNTNNAGPLEGNGLVREVDDPVWSYPPVGDLVRVTVRPAE